MNEIGTVGIGNKQYVPSKWVLADVKFPEKEQIVLMHHPDDLDSAQEAMKIVARVFPYQEYSLLASEYMEKGTLVKGPREFFEKSWFEFRGIPSPGK